MKYNGPSGFANIPLLLGAAVVLLVSLSGYLLYSNTQLQERNELLDGAAQSASEQKNLEMASSTASSTQAAKIQTAPVSPPKAGAVKSVEPRQAETTSSNSGWNEVYQAIADKEEVFFDEFDLIDFDVLLGQTNIDLQKRLVGNSLKYLSDLTTIVQDGKKKFPSQVACLNKEQEAIDKFTLGLNSSLKFFDNSALLIKLDEIEVNIVNKAGSYVYRLQIKEYDKAIQDLDSIKQLVSEAQNTISLANQIIPMDAVGDYIKWAEAYTVGLNEIQEALRVGNYNYKPAADFVVIGEMKTKASADLIKQITEWTVANLNTVLVEAGQFLSASNQLCKKDE